MSIFLLELCVGHDCQSQPFQAVAEGGVLMLSQLHKNTTKTKENQVPNGFTLQFSSRWYLCAREGTYVLHPVSQEFVALETVTMLV